MAGRWWLPGEAAGHDDDHGPVDIGFVMGGQLPVIKIQRDLCQEAVSGLAAGIAFSYPGQGLRL
jgi:hypothetical protein